MAKNDCEVEGLGRAGCLLLACRRAGAGTRDYVDYDLEFYFAFCTSAKASSLYRQIEQAIAMLLEQR